MEYQVEDFNKTIRGNDPLTRKPSNVLVSELRNIIMRSTVVQSKKVAKRARARKVLLREKGMKGNKPDGDSDISSDDCDDNGAIFQLMGDEDKAQHVIALWKRAYLKGRAGAQVIRFFADLARKIYLFGVSKRLEEIEKEEIPPPFIL